MAATTVTDSVKSFYGENFSTAKATCCSGAEHSPSLKGIIETIHPEVNARYYGCGPVFPECVMGCRVVDLGSGSGRDCYILSKLVGPSGFVTGVDMTREQLEVSRKHIGYHMDVFSYSSPNVEFVEGYIEDLGGCGIAKESVDIVVSNCVICTCEDKGKVIAEVFKILKPGGELYFSDMYADRPIPQDFPRNEVFWSEGYRALEWKQLMNISQEVGFAPPILVEVSPMVVTDKDIQKTLGDIKYCSATYRIFKVDPKQEKSLTTVKYHGTIENSPASFKLAHNIEFQKSKETALPTSVAQVLAQSRYARHFSFSASSPSNLQDTPTCPELSDFAKLNPFGVFAPSSS